MANSTCSAPACTKPVHVKKRGLCRSHYNRWMYAGDLSVNNADAICVKCGASISREGRRGPSPCYCGASCRAAAAYERRKDVATAERRAATASRLASTVKDCPACGSSFTPERTLKQRFCSRACCANFHRDRNRGTCRETDCDRPVRARGMCAMHWRRWARAEGNEANPGWTDARRANHHKRRALKKKLPAADIRPRDIYERDSWACGLCGDGIDPDAAWPDPLSASLDHILPLSKGGHHVPENVQAAHLSCNVRKGNRVEADAMSA